ncbi:MAG: methylmalonyl-CoA mutase family protein [Acidobacteriota bacterium]
MSEARTVGAVGYEGWRQKVEADLRGADVDKALAYRGLDDLGLRALEHESTAPTAGDPSGLPGVAPFTRGTRLPSKTAGHDAWKVALALDCRDARQARRHLRHDLGLGVGSLWLRLQAGRSGGIGIPDLDGFRALLDGVDLSILDVTLDTGDPRLGAALLAELVADPATLSGSLAADPIGAWVEGESPALDGAFDRLASAVRWCSEHAPDLRAGHHNAVLWHDKGASPTQELALTLAGAVETLRRLEARGVAPGQAATQMLSVFAVGRRTFLEIAKLRAWRWLLSKVLKAAGACDVAGRQRLAVAPGRIHLTRVDPWVNLLRATAQTFTAACAGADLIVTPRYDQLWRHDDIRSRRYSINLQHVLAQEAHLGRVVDPAGGSWALERMTTSLARSAWDLFRDYERSGGLVACLGSGRVHGDLRATVAERHRRLRKRLDPMIGVSFFPLIDEKRPSRSDRLVEGASDDPMTDSEPGDNRAGGFGVADVTDIRSALGDGAPLAAVAAAACAPDPSCRPIPDFRSAEGFEALRLAVDAAVEAGAERPRVLLAGLGSAQDSRARREFAAGFFSVGGLDARVEDGFGEARDLDGLSAAAEGTLAVVLCSTDERYGELVPAAAKALGGGPPVYVAGRPGPHAEAWADAGVDGYIYLGCDVLAVLEAVVSATGWLKGDGREGSTS